MNNMYTGSIHDGCTIILLYDIIREDLVQQVSRVRAHHGQFINGSDR